MISVIVPNYNHSKFLRQRLDSILLQTYQDFELIILDDLSPDNSKEIIELYRSHPKVSHIIYNEINSGSTFKQWEKGILLAKGDWIWIAESDDWCEPNFLETLIKGALSSDNISVAFSQTYMLGYKGDNVEYCLAEFSGKNIEYIVDGQSFVLNKMLPFTGVWNASQVIFRKDNFYSISKEYTKYRFCGDWIFWVEMSLLGKVFISAKFLSYFRKHELDVTSRASKDGSRFKEEILALKYLDNLMTGYVRKNNMFFDHYIRFLNSLFLVSKKERTIVRDLFMHQLSFAFRMKGYLRYFYRYLIAVKNSLCGEKI